MEEQQRLREVLEVERGLAAHWLLSASTLLTHSSTCLPPSTTWVNHLFSWPQGCPGKPSKSKNPNTLVLSDQTEFDTFVWLNCASTLNFMSKGERVLPEGPTVILPLLEGFPKYIELKFCWSFGLRCCAMCRLSQLSSDVRICFLGAALLYRLRGLARLTGWDKTSLFNFSTSCFLCLRTNLYFSYSDIGQHLRLIIILIFPLKGPSTKKNNFLQTNFWTPRSVLGFGLKQSIFLWRISLNVRISCFQWYLIP